MFLRIEDPKISVFPGLIVFSKNFLTNEIENTSIFNLTLTWKHMVESYFQVCPQPLPLVVGRYPGWAERGEYLPTMKCCSSTGGQLLREASS